ncbi:chromate efflux transporter [Halocynthiibacter namhaensis]|uniref:chromate efflux transporter n=1 Tax=Halocynthiibacter namhaensis TaxID=1290553 RepID=UPI0005793DEA|nr:chromate efflux transporter [Halocynthiibacter namhaensis]
MNNDIVSYRELFRVFGRIGVMSFGGPAAQIALMHRELVEDRPWLSEDSFLNALSFCMLLPGPEAMQLATWAGWKKRGIPGGLIAGGLFVIPGALMVLALALAYARFGALPWVQSLFLGVKAAVVVIVIEALLKVSKRAFGQASGASAQQSWVIAGLSFLGIFALNIPFPIIIFLAGLWGYFTALNTHQQEAPKNTHKPVHSLWVIMFGILIWALPFAFISASPAADFLTHSGIFFSKLAVVTFGGAYAVLAYMTQEVVSTNGWLSTQEMLDALGLAETTPGPLILVTEFVATLAAHKQGGVSLAIGNAVLTLWVTFVPCFIWIFAGAPWVERIMAHPRLRAGLQAITAAVVGVIANLSIWFALHVFFDQVDTTEMWMFSLLNPVLSSLNLSACVLAGLSAYLLLVRKWNLLIVLGVLGISGLLINAIL